MAAASTPEHPLPVRQVSRLVGDWIHRLGFVWVEGELAQINRRPGARVVFLTLRDTDASMSLSVTCPPEVLDAMDVPLTEGARVVLHAKPTWYAGRGTLSLSATEIRPIGLGELLARIETLKRMLAAEGLFDADRKRPLPFLPRAIGLISGRGSAAERDVLENARRRWPGARFEVRSTPVQGAAAVPGIVEALTLLGGRDDVDVIVIARGGGSVEDLLPFSDEVLLRAVARCTIPVVSAIGHEQDTPLLDLVADVRASTPTDAARRIVPDLAEQLAGIDQARRRAHHAVQRSLEREHQRLHALLQHPVLRSADAFLQTHRDRISALSGRGTDVVSRRVHQASVDARHQRERLFLLSPASTLARGYAIVQRTDGHVVRSGADLAVGEPISVRLADGTVAAQVTSSIDQNDPAVGSS
jgi:exodeoxyribonuclease VII large subunit